MIRFFCISGLRRSRYLYFSRMSSFVSLLSRSKGRAGHLLKTSSSSILISTVPAGEFLFSVPFGLSLTCPLILIQDSFVNDFAVVKFVSSFAVVIVWTVPVMSRISRNINFPCFLIVSIHPLISTFLFVEFGRSLIIVLSIIVHMCLGL